MTSAVQKDSSRAIAIWLFTCAFAVLLMALVGAITRLTESGLSIVKWEPVIGTLPPLTAGDWEKEFAAYRTSPQYQKVNRGMTLPEFKKIYFWEWFHRLWGRVIGLLYALPLIWFWLRRRLPSESKPALLGVLGLGFLQGFMGWFMVKSGLVDMPAVSHYRLAAHLMLAFLIFACLFRMGLAFSLRPIPDAGRLAPLRGMIKGAIALAVLTMTWGAFVAGLDAGLLYNTFPKMDAHWIPPELSAHTPVWKAFFEEPATVQFTHRILGILTALKVVYVWKRSRGFNADGRIPLLFSAAAVMVLLQVGLGIVTLLSHVHIVPATVHQGGALVLLGLLVWLLHEIPDIKREK
jgi:cytochrome c oxidase assembly protein subunit 15